MKCEPRIAWSIGQTLLPEHLRGLEDVILSDSAVRGTLAGLPYYGFSRLRFGKAFKTDGLLTLESGIMVSRSGRLLAVAENAYINTLNLNTAGANRLKVFLHVMPADELHERWRVPMSAADGTQPIQTWQWRLHLSLDEEIQGTLEYLPLAIVEKDINSQWIFAPDFIPPLLNVGYEVFLRAELESLRQELEKYQKILREELADIHLAGENLINIRRCQVELRFFLNYLSNVLGEVKPHPFEFFQRLQRLYLEISNYQVIEPAGVGNLYRHDDLAGCLIGLVNATLGLLRRDKELTPMEEFRLSSGVWRLEMSDSCVTAAKWYFLVQKPTVQLKIDFESVKFASLSRLNIIHKYFLQGVIFKKIDRPLFQHYFGPEVDIYELLQDEELVQARNERTLAFLDEKRFEGLKFFLYWSQL
ncbi:MAG: type VI secretion system baseplate subunit TssK [Methylococcus sp.]